MNLTRAMENEKASRRAVKSYIKLLAEKTGTKYQQEKVFVDWYSDLRKAAGFEIKHKSIGGDGGIDLILESKDKFIISQLKYWEVPRKEVENFNRTIRNWNTEATFDSWLSAEVRDPTCRTNYQYTFSKIIEGKVKVAWEFVSLNSLSEGTFERWEETLRKDMPKSRKYETRLITAGRLNYFVMMDKLGGGPTEPLKVNIDKNTNTSFGATIEGTPITTHLCVMHLDSLIKKLREQPDSQAFFARNVRLLRKESDVNRSIVDTYEHDHESFFFDNNGISILSTGVSFKTEAVEMTEPTIINGGQTINSLLNLKSREARVLARITEITDSDQTKPAVKRFVDDMIQRSNSNNTMYPWDLRSNDPCQVDLAKNLLERDVFYERKQGEHDISVLHRSNVKLIIDLTRLAQNIVVCGDNACGPNKGGPAYLKQIGLEPLFKNEAKGTVNCYKKIFMGKPDYDQTYRQTILFLALHSSLRSIRRVKTIPDDFNRFKNASENFVYGIFWRTIKDDDDLQELKYNGGKTPKIKAVSAELVSKLFEMVETRLTNGTIRQNDIFRNQSYWKETRTKFLTAKWNERISKAVGDELVPS